ncbi:hypothetical protein [Kribbella sp. NPDC000426]|uniref:hypothetical protein n=1 Tax=Kribbella sp. NPDC000426 TaxID=3154255 RepID=UPI003330000F
MLAPHLLQSRTGPADQTKTSAWSQWAGLTLPKNIYASVQVYGANRQDAELQLLTGNPWPTYCQLQVHRNGDFDPGRIPAGSQRLPAGRIVTSTKKKPFPPAPLGYRFPLSGDTYKTLVWQPAEGLWGLITCEAQRQLGTRAIPQLDGPFDPDVAVALQVAEAMTTGPAKLGSPFVANGLPDGLTARRITYSPAKGNVEGSGEEFAATFSDGDPTTGYVRPASRDCSQSFRPGTAPKACTLPGNGAFVRQLGDDLEISYSTGKFWNQYSRFMKPVAIIHGMKAYYVYGNGIAAANDKNQIPPRDAVRLEGNGVAVTIQSLSPNPSMAELRTIAEKLQLTTSPNTPTNWFDAATSIP